jgi:hypothetical protein
MQAVIITKLSQQKLVELHNTPNTLRCRLEQSTAKRPGFLCKMPKTGRLLSVIALFR